MNQIESLNVELDRLRGELEVLNNSLENAQRRQCDMYLDLDTRLRRFEGEAGATVRPLDRPKQWSCADGNINRPPSAVQSANSMKVLRRVRCTIKTTRDMPRRCERR